MEQTFYSKITSLYNENKMLINLISSIFGLLILGVTICSIFRETTDKNIVIENWFEQYSESASCPEILRAAKMQYQLKNVASGSLKTSEKIRVREMGALGKFYNLYSFVTALNKPKYMLIDENSGKDIKEIRLSQNATAIIGFIRENQSLTLTLHEDDIFNLERHLNSGSLLEMAFPSNYVIASSGDVHVAYINENVVCAVEEGETTLNLFVDNTLFKYRIIVK